tara:strand:+ start:69 stop:533 length:465 start_codon:yes stop_codon:yes gene_type:complete
MTEYDWVKPGQSVLEEEIIETPFTSYYEKPVRLKSSVAKALLSAQELIPDVPVSIVDNYIPVEQKIERRKEWIAGGRKGPYQAGRKSFHSQGQAIDLNQEDPKMRDPKVWEALEKAGFSQHPDEWWHWSIGEFIEKNLGGPVTQPLYSDKRYLI